MNNLTHQDQLHRQLALDPQQSFIVQAPAGSGKTELIIQRMLTLLAHVKKPEEILAITFTKKSAHEMRARILKALDQASLPEPEKAHEKLTWQLANAVLQRDKNLQWNLVTNPNQLNIKTIDSFCTYLTGQLPMLSHFGSQPAISTYSQGLYREAILEVLSHIEETHAWSPTIARLLEHTDNDTNKLVTLLMQMLQTRDQWQSLLFANHEMSDNDRRNLLSRQIANVIQFNLEQAVDLFPAEQCQELLALLQFTAAFLPENGMISEMPAGDPDDLGKWQTIAEFVLTKENEWRKQTHKSIGFPTLKSLEKSELPLHRSMHKRHEELVAALKLQPGLQAMLTVIRILPPPSYTDAQWEILKDLLEVLKIVLAQLRVTFQLHGQIDFIENAAGALQALGNNSNPTDLALSLDYQIKHILVDEFQDTSYTQYSLLQMLTYGWQQNDGRSLFVVGDPMQSIYRFRQAEVGIFIRMQNEGIGDLRLTPLQLAVNFRSTPQIVEWNNQQFTSIFPSASDIGTGAVEYSHSIANQAKADQDHSFVTLKGFIEANEHTQADAVIDYIKYIYGQYPDEKIAILVRSRPHLSAIIPALKAANLQYNAVEIDPLITRQCIQDCLALTRALMHPADRVAWLAVLRAPWCGLTLNDLLLLCSNHKHAMLLELIQDQTVINQLSDDGKNRIHKITPVLQDAINNRERMGFREWVENTWLTLGGPASLNDYSEIADINEYFDLLSELTANAERINLEILKERISELRASSMHDTAPIQIMTIHSAKGLEFDTVILPHLEKANAKDDPALLLWMDQPLHADQTALLLAPLHAVGTDKDALYAYIESTQKIKSQYEVDRLFYVAATRAKKRLHLIFSVSGKETAAPKGSFLHKLWPLIEAETKPEASLVDNDASAQQTANIRKINRFAADWKNPVNIITRTEKSSYQVKDGFKLRDDTPRLIGTISHFILQQLSITGIDWWQTRTDNEKQRYITQQLHQAGLPPSKHFHAVKNISDIITRTITDTRGQWILAPHLQAKSEYKISVANDNGSEQLVIDRTFIDETGSRWIIDYKTAENQDDDITVFLEKQKEKYREQMQKYHSALKNIGKEPIKMGLYFPSIPAWCEI